MDLTQILSPHRIDLHVDVPTKKRALEVICEQCANAKERNDFFEALVEREKLGSTGLGFGVALPHARLKNLKTPVACLIKLKTPVDFDAPDGEKVDTMLGLFVPEDDNETALQLLSHIASVFNKAEIRDAIRDATSNEQVLKLITQQLREDKLAS